MAYNTDIERLNYYEGEYLGAADFQAEQEYHRDMRRRHNIGQHTWGIVSGLEIVQIPNGGTASGGQPEVDIFIQPGMAIDAFGREIISLSKISLTQDLLAAYYDPNPAGLPRPMAVWIAFSQEMLSPSTDKCVNQNQSNAFGRVQESWRIVIGPISDVPANDAILVDGSSMAVPIQLSTSPTPPPPPNPGDVVIPYDGSVPYQEFSTDDSALNWYVPLGRILWDSHNELFIQQPDALTASGRFYAGNVTAAIYSPFNKLSILDRFAPSPLPEAIADPFYPGVAVDLLGSLTVERQITAKKDVWIYEPGRLNFKNTNGLDADATLWIGRVSNPAGGADLHLHIGDTAAAPLRRLVVGSGPDTPPDGSAEKILFDVKADGNVGIPIGALTFGNKSAQLINVDSTSYGIGVQTNTLFFRTNSDFAWYVGGTFDPGQDQPGGSGTLAMTLNPAAALTIPTGSLNFGQQTRQMINLWKSEYGIGVQPATLFFRSASDFCWYRGGTFVDVKDNPGGGFSSMTLDSTGNLTIAGNLRVLGAQNIFGVKQFTKVVTNASQETPGSWSISYAGIFSAVYSAFAVFQGFSIWPNGAAFDFHPHGQTNVKTIPQHAFVRVDGFDANGAHGVAYCSESDSTLETDNCVLFTLIVLGQPII